MSVRELKRQEVMGPCQPERDWIAGRSSVDGGELPAGETGVEAVPAGGCARAGASQRGTTLQPEQTGGTAGTSASDDSREVQRRGRAALRADVGRRASEQ